MIIRKLMQATLLCCMIGAILVGCKDDDDTIYVSINKLEVTLNPGDSCQLKVSVQDNSKDYMQAVAWSVKEATLEEGATGDVVSIDENGMVRALNYGEATIQAKLENGRYALSVVKVEARKGPGDDKISFAEKSYYMTASNFTDSLILNVDPAYLKLYPLTITSDNEEVLIVSNELIPYGKTEGVYKISITPKGIDQKEPVTVTATLGESHATCLVYVGVKLYLSFSEIGESLPDGTKSVLDQKNFKFGINNKGLDTINIHYDCAPKNQEVVRNIDFKISTTGQLIVLSQGFYEQKDQYYIVVGTGSQKGEGTVTLEALGAKVSGKCEIFNRDDFNVESVTLAATNVETDLAIYDLFETLEVAPFGVTDYWPIVWTSSNEEIAKVDKDGKVSFYSPGEVVITAKVKDKTANCHFKTKLSASSLKIVQLSTKDEYYVGEQAKWDILLNANYSKVPTNYFKWSSSDESVATVDANGHVKAVSVGKTIIKVSVTDDLGRTVTDQKEITVKSVSDVNIYDVNITSTFKYYADLQGGGTSLEVYDDNSTTNKNFLTFYLSKKIDLSVNKVYTIGSDLSGTVIYMDTEETATLTEGTIAIENQNITFDISVQKLNKTAKIKGTVNK